MSEIKVDVHYLTRVEGHGNIVLDAVNGDIKQLRLEIVEAPRFFESFLRGTNYKDVAYIASRVCGICSIGHNNASIKATENAFGIQISNQTVLLRKLMLHGENLQSHSLHVYFLAAPDFFGVPSVLPLIKTNPNIAKLALKMKRLANDLSDLSAGRTVHPLRNIVGGVTMVPSKEELNSIKERLEESKKDILFTAELFKKSVKIPQYERETEYIALKKEDEFAIYEGKITSSDGMQQVDDINYKTMIKEFVVPHSTAKHSRNNRNSYMVGALARCNLSFNTLKPFAKQIADILGFKSICYNPYMNTVAQVIEIAHSVEDSIEIINYFLDKGFAEPLSVEVKPKAGIGVGVVDVPRGILFHEYEYDNKGNIISANLVIPTAQNLENIEDDMRKFVPIWIKEGKSQDEIRLLLEMLVRAYDPCISCSAHILNVKFQ